MWKSVAELVFPVIACLAINKRFQKDYLWLSDPLFRFTVLRLLSLSTEFSISNIGAVFCLAFVCPGVLSSNRNIDNCRPQSHDVLISQTFASPIACMLAGNMSELVCISLSRL